MPSIRMAAALSIADKTEVRSRQPTGDVKTQ